MLVIVELLNIQSVVLEKVSCFYRGFYFKFNECAFVVIDIAVVRGRKNCDDGWEIFFSVPLVHFVALNLSLMGSNKRQQSIFIHKLINRLHP